MGITHVIRGDDHVNNTPRQINILAALGAKLPLYGHLPMILDGEGKKLSKRTGAAAVTEFEDMGYLPETMLNYLARLGWAHGDDEVFSMEQFCAWFDLDHLTSSAARFDMEKLNWLNNHYIKAADPGRLESLVRPRLEALGAQFNGAPALQAAIAMLRERAHTTKELAEAAIIFYRQPEPAADLLVQHMTDAIKPAMAQFAEACKTVEWNKAAISAALKEVLAAHKLKMPQLAMPLRLALTGQLQTPAIDAVIELFGRETVTARLAKYVA
jgi:glutamyl-tRNA synthetase